MDDIKVTCNIDLKTYFRISLFLYYKLRSIIIMLIMIGIGQVFITTAYGFDWLSEISFLAVVLIFYIGLNPLLIYFSCKRNIKKSAYLRETIYYIINPEKIEYKGDTISSTSNWQYVVKFIEREKYFLIMVSVRNFHYLPKAGF